METTSENTKARGINPLTNSDVEELLKKAGNSRKLDLSGKDLRQLQMPFSDLAGSNLRNVRLCQADLRGTNFYEADLTGADLTGAFLSGADLRKANLTNADLRKADVRHTLLNGAILRGAKLQHTILNYSNLTGADLDGALLHGAFLNGTNLSGTILSEIDANKTITNVAKANPANIQEVAAAQLNINNNYYESALQQSQRSFLSALIWASIGTLLIIAAIIFLLTQQPANLSYVSLIGGAVVEGIAGLNFYLYGRASDQLTHFQTPLERIGRFLLANSICENLEGDIKHTTRSRLVETIANITTEAKISHSNNPTVTSKN